VNVDISSTKITAVIVHRVGNKGRDEALTLSHRQIKTSDEINGLLLRTYLGILKNEASAFSFHHESDLSLNEIRKYSGDLFSDDGRFVELSHSIAKHLYAQSTHPNIQAGELLTILFSGIVIDGKKQRGLGIFKVENKEDFLHILDSRDQINIEPTKGILVGKIQKGALILENKLRVFATDNVNKGAQYWFNDFLKVLPEQNSANQTKFAGALVKKLCSKMSDAKAEIEFKQEIERCYQEADEICFGDIRAASEKHLSSEVFSSSMNELKKPEQVEISDNSKIASKILAQQVKSVISKTKIIDGVDLLISGQIIEFSSLSLKKSGDEIKVSITLRSKE
jgi:hypothetical protein